MCEWKAESQEQDPTGRERVPGSPRRDGNLPRFGSLKGYEGDLPEGRDHVADGVEAYIHSWRGEW